MFINPRMFRNLTFSDLCDASLTLNQTVICLSNGVICNLTNRLCCRQNVALSFWVARCGHGVFMVSRRACCRLIRTLAMCSFSHTDPKSREVVLNACKAVGSISNTSFDIRFNPDIFSPGGSSCMSYEGAHRRVNSFR